MKFPEFSPNYVGKYSLTILDTTSMVLDNFSRLHCHYDLYTHMQALSI